MLGEHALTERLALDLPNRVPDAGPFKAKLEAADACEQRADPKTTSGHPSPAHLTPRHRAPRAHELAPTDAATRGVRAEALADAAALLGHASHPREAQPQPEATVG